jgi:hypothetical protein
VITLPDDWVHVAGVKEAYDFCAPCWHTARTALIGSIEKGFLGWGDVEYIAREYARTHGYPEPKPFKTKPPWWPWPKNKRVALRG